MKIHFILLVILAGLAVMPLAAQENPVANVTNGYASDIVVVSDAQQQALDQEATSVVGQVNSLTTSIAQLNQQIMSTSPDADAGTLEDQRQSDLSQLSQLIGIN